MAASNPVAVSWHHRRCRQPDVSLAGEVPYCASCDTLAVIEQAAEDAICGIPAIPIHWSQQDIQLSWPKTVEYSDNSIPATAEQSALPAPIQPLVPELPGNHGSPFGSVATEVTSESGADVPPWGFGSYREPNPTRSAELARNTGPNYAALTATDHIRLLLLSRGRFDDPLHGTLVLSRLSGAVEFQALSYTWADSEGDSTRTKVIFLGPKWDALSITANCKDALQHMRQTDRDIMVWVDAICIDQGNHIERNHQVGLMRAVYASATAVFVYLDDGTHWDANLLDRLMWTKDHLNAKGRPFEAKFFKIPYFSRIWVIQEISNAREATINIGKSKVGWSLFNEERMRAAGILEEIPRWTWTVYNRQGYLSRDVGELLLATHSSKASDPRDRVFALFGLIRDARETGLMADYALTVQEVYVGIAAFLLTKYGDSSILQYAVGANRYGFPTWTPTWDELARPPIGRVREPTWPVKIPRAATMHDRRLVLKAKDMPKTLQRITINRLGAALNINATLIKPSKFAWSWSFSVETKAIQWTRKATYRGMSAAPDGLDSRSFSTIAILQGCSQYFVLDGVTAPQQDTFRIAGTMTLLFPPPDSTPSRNASISNADLPPISRYMLEHCPLERGELRLMLILERYRRSFWAVGTADDLVPIESLEKHVFEDYELENIYVAYLVSTAVEPPSIPVKRKHHDIEQDDEASPYQPSNWLLLTLAFWERHGSWTHLQKLTTLYWEAFDCIWSIKLFRAAKRCDDIVGVTVDATVWLNQTYIMALCERIQSATQAFARFLSPSRRVRCAVRVNGREFVLISPKDGSTGHYPLLETVELEAELLALGKIAYGDGEEFYEINEEKCNFSEFRALLEELEDLGMGKYELEQFERDCAFRSFLRLFQPYERTWQLVNIV